MAEKTLHVSKFVVLSSDATSLDDYNESENEKLIKPDRRPFVNVSWRLPSKQEIKGAVDSFYNSSYHGSSSHGKPPPATQRLITSIYASMGIRSLMDTSHRFLQNNPRYAEIIPLFKHITVEIMMDTVRSLLSDCKVWNAILENEGIKRLRKVLNLVTYSEMIDTSPSEDSTHSTDSTEKPSWASRIITWIFDKCKAMFSVISEIGASIIDEAKSSWVVSIFTSLIVIVTRAFRAVYDDLCEPLNADQ